MKLKKILILGLVLSVVVLIGGYAGYRGYKVARQHRLIKQARGFLEKANQRKALLTLQRALRYNPKDVEACRLMADLGEAAHSPSALLWRSRVVELKPNSTDDRLALAQTALMLQDLPAATNALEGVNVQGKETAGYHNIAGTAALRLNQLSVAEAHFLKASQIEPQNAAPQLNLAVVQLHGTNTAAMDKARTTLNGLSGNPTNSILRCLALRELVVDAMRNSRTNDALTLSKSLIDQTNSVFQDQILRLGILRDTHHPDFKATQLRLQAEAANDPVKSSELGSWQISKSSSAEAFSWMRTLPLETQTNQPMAMLIADTQSALKDWRGLQQSLEHQQWGELDFIRHAFMTRALKGQDLVGAAKGEWEQALQSTQNQKLKLTTLLRLAAQWNWMSDAEELLWNIVNRYPSEKRAYQTLNDTLFASGRTRPLMMLYSQELKRSPTDLGAKNNLALVALLLDAQELKPHELAREVYEKEPTNAAYVSTYAFSLYLQKKNAEAIKVIEQLKPQELDNPSVAGYYGLMLKAAGETEKARAFLQWSAKARLLPEERKLFEQAKTGA